MTSLDPRWLASRPHSGGTHSTGQAVLECVRRQFKNLEDHVPTLGEVAKVLGLSERTLRRRLKTLETSYSKVLEEVRRDWAEAALVGSSLSIEQISSMLGYSEATNFRHAFRRWAGTSPNAFRERAQSGRDLGLTNRAA